MPPNTADFSRATPKSSQKSTLPCSEAQKVPLSRPSTCTAWNQPALMASEQKNTVSNGTHSTAAQKRGATVLATGSMAISSSALIWSVARIRPSSAAIELPARPMNSSAVSTGPSSRYSDRPSRVARASEAPKVARVRWPCRVSTRPTNAPPTTMIGSERPPIL